MPLYILFNLSVIYNSSGPKIYLILKLFFIYHVYLIIFTANANMLQIGGVLPLCQKWTVPVQPIHHLCTSGRHSYLAMHCRQLAANKSCSNLRIPNLQDPSRSGVLDITFKRYWDLHGFLYAIVTGMHQLPSQARVLPPEKQIFAGETLRPGALVWPPHQHYPRRHMTLSKGNRGSGVTSECVVYERNDVWSKKWKTNINSKNVK